MDPQDFEMPSAKRQKTNSPPSNQHTSTSLPNQETGIAATTAQSEMHNEPDSTPLEDTTPAAMVEQAQKKGSSAGDMLDVLMQHVESESSTNPAQPVPVQQIQALVDTEKDILMQEHAVTVNAQAVPVQEEVQHDQESRMAAEQQAQPAGVAQDTTLPPGLEATDKPSLEHLQAVAEVNGLPPTADTLVEAEIPQATDGPISDAQVAPEAREWETDSSPVDSDSSDTTSDSSDDSSEDSDEEEYTLLDPYEQARILMAEDGGGGGGGGAGSDDEDGSSVRNTNTRTTGGAGLRTQNEKPDEILPKPNITLTPDMRVEELGTIQAIIENTVLVKAKTSGEYQVLESGSILCLEDRKVIGAVHETLGRVEEPLYTVRFASATDIQESGVSEKGTKIYYVHDHSSFVFTQPLKAYKGSDASNFHDEEVGDDEMEFSDDEKEAEYKRQQKLRKKGIDPSKSLREAGVVAEVKEAAVAEAAWEEEATTYTSMPGIPESDAYNSSNLEMNYDDVEEGETTPNVEYTPLRRPETLSNQVSLNSVAYPPTQRNDYPAPRRGNDRGRGSFNNRGNRGNNRGGSGTRGRGNPNHNSNNNTNTNHTSSYNQPQSQSQYQPQTQNQNTWTPSSSSMYASNPNQQQQTPYYPTQQQQQQQQPYHPFQPPPPPPQLTPYQSTHSNGPTVPPSPMTPLPGAGYAFNFQQGGQNQNQNQMNMWAQYHQNQAQQYQAQTAQYGGAAGNLNANADAIAQVQRQLEELRRQSGQGGGWQGQGGSNGN